MKTGNGYKRREDPATPSKAARPLSYDGKLISVPFEFPAP